MTNKVFRGNEALELLMMTELRLTKAPEDQDNFSEKELQAILDQVVSVAGRSIASLSAVSALLRTTLGGCLGKPARAG